MVLMPTSDPHNSLPPTNPPPPPSRSSLFTSQSPSLYINAPTNPPLMASHKPQNPIKIQDQPSSVIFPPPSQGTLPGRGFYLRPPQSTDHPVTLTNSGGFPSRPLLPFPNQIRGLGLSSADQQHVHMMRPPTLQSSQFESRSMGAAVSVGPTKIIHSKASPSSTPLPDLNSKDLGDKDKDDTVVTINGRKVKLVDGASLYANCRSWVRNGLPQESQPQVEEGMKLLPRPLPASRDTDMEKRSTYQEQEEEEGSVDHLSTRELLQKHIDRAKRVRARLRKERLQRIERYKQRLALLLPTPDEQLTDDNRL